MTFGRDTPWALAAMAIAAAGVAISFLGRTVHLLVGQKYRFEVELRPGLGEEPKVMQQRLSSAFGGGDTFSILETTPAVTRVAFVDTARSDKTIRLGRPLLEFQEGGRTISVSFTSVQEVS